MTSHTQKDPCFDARWEDFGSDDEQADNGGIARWVLAAGAPFLAWGFGNESDDNFDSFKP